MYERILIPTDGSRDARRATAYGLDLAAQTEASVHILSVVDTRLTELSGSDGVESILDAMEASCREAVDAAAAGSDDVTDVSRTVRHGTPVEEILSCADEHGVELVVMGTKGSADSRLGSTAERVVALADTPVLTVGSSADPPSLATLNDIVVPTDGSEPAERAAEHALRFAELFGATLHTVYVIDESVYDLKDAPRSIVGLLREGGERATEAALQGAEAVNIRSTARVLRGHPTQEILDYIEGVDADLVVMGTRGRSGLPEHLLGSTTRRVVRDAKRPVLSVS